MGDKTAIKWTDSTWNPVSGCTPASPGCDNCYARGIGQRFHGGFDVKCHEDRLEIPLRWKTPRQVFLCSMGDLFHEEVPDSFIERVFYTMAQCQQHTFQVLTKRPERMLDFFSTHETPWPEPLGHVWLGVTAENQEMADRRIPLLLQTPAAVRFVSVEPMLGAVSLARWLDVSWIDLPGGKHCTENIGPGPELDWVIVGGESGPKARPMHPDWVRWLRDESVASGTAFFFKQWGEWLPSDQKNADGMDGQMWQAGIEIFGGTPNRRHEWSKRLRSHRTGTKLAGHLLDGMEWHQFPEARA